MSNHILSLGTARAQFAGIICLILLICIFLSYSLVGQNYYVLFGIVALVIGTFLIKSRILPLIIILLIIPFADWAVEYGMLPFQVMWLPELLSGLLFVRALLHKAIERQKLITFGMRFVMGFLILTFLSLLLNNSGFVPALLMLRLLFRYYLLFLAIINLGLAERSMRLINNLLVFIFLAQLPLSVLKLFTFGQGETSLGLSSHSVTTIFPLIAIGFLFSFYIFYKRKYIFILGILAFVGFAIIGGKRAFIFFLPVLLVYIAWIARRNFALRPKFLVLGIFIVFISFYFVARLVPTLNPQREIWGEFNPKHIVNYAVEYETGYSKSGIPIGRVSATLEVFRSLKMKGVSGFAIGNGPGTIIKSMFSAYDKREAIRSIFGVGYGLNGLSWLGIQVGYLGMIIYFSIFYLFLRKLLVYLEMEQDPYWKSLSLGMVGFTFILIITSLVYDPFFTNDAVAAFYFCLLGIIILRQEYSKSIHQSRA